MRNIFLFKQIIIKINDIKNHIFALFISFCLKFKHLCFTRKNCVMNFIYSLCNWIRAVAEWLIAQACKILIFEIQEKFLLIFMLFIVLISKITFFFLHHVRSFTNLVLIFWMKSYLKRNSHEQLCICSLATVVLAT